MKIYLEDVFKKSGLPTYTFVRPSEYNNILVALRTKGRGIIVEGPSGIGKTTSIRKAVEELNLNKKITNLSARKQEDREYIHMIPEFKDMGTVIVDDFHVLNDEIKSLLANFMKVLADEERQNDKLILIGINKAGSSLINMATDLNNRIDTIKFEKNSDEKISELIALGEEALNITINTKQEIVNLANGGFHIAQYLCSEICTMADILERNDNQKRTNEISIELVKEKVLAEFARAFYSKAKTFATGTRLVREGRAPYLHLLYWVSQSEDWTIQMEDIMRAYPEQKLSISQVVSKGHLQSLIEQNEIIQDVIHYDANSLTLTIEDPKFMFYIRNLLWAKFSRQIGYVGFNFDKPYDYALSFAGEDRLIAEKIFNILSENHVSVFYDKNEQSRILAENVEDYLAPIYSSQATFVIALLSQHYPRKIWTKFESDNFKQRFGDNSIIPIWYSNSTPGLFDETRKYGGITFETDDDADAQAQSICIQLLEKIAEERQKAASISVDL